jgi:hypothetical protein
MHRAFWATTAVVVGALFNTVPSKAAFHPTHARTGLNESDISGSGNELRRGSSVQGNSRGDRTASSATEWRAMAARCRNLAQWQNAEHREILLRLAEEYEARAESVDRTSES